MELLPRMATLWTSAPMLWLVLLLAFWSPYASTKMDDLFNADDRSRPNLVTNWDHREIITGSHLSNSFFPTALVIGLFVTMLAIIGEILKKRKGVNNFKVCLPSNLFLICFFLLTALSTGESSNSSCNASDPSMHSLCPDICVNLDEKKTTKKSCGILYHNITIKDDTNMTELLSGVKKIVGQINISNTQLETFKIDDNIDINVRNNDKMCDKFFNERFYSGAFVNNCQLVCLNVKEMDIKQCTVLDFDLVIGNMTRINASALANIKEITGELRIERTRLEFIRFPNLTTIGSLTVTENRLMKSIQLPKLKYFSSAKMEKVYIKDNGFAWSTKEINNFLNETDLYICNVHFDAFNIAHPLSARLLGLIWLMSFNVFIILVTIAAGCYYCPRCISAKIRERGAKSLFHCLRFLVLKDVYEKKVEQLEKEERKLRSKMSPGDKERHWQKSKAYNRMPYFGPLIPK